ncbi:U32 family peptidase [Candidatus Parcubacteria bacterium]|nr:U32 family peptidase [Candidatus Parcubacteria bacterium]
MKRPEIMSPIKDWASLEACKNYADAVYFGASDLSLRARANNLKLSELTKFVAKCHEYKIKAYLTLNSTLYNKDLAKAEKIMKKAKQAKVDMVIVWDPAMIAIAKKEKVKFLVSTQANISNWQTARFYEKLGASKIVLAREMTLKQIIELKKKVNIEIETFVHGAMCMAISGRCILSAYLYGNSANCGSCSQPCRKEWILSDEEGNKIANEGKYFMNSKDLCMIEHIPALIKAGISSFKIEGRKRDPRYIATTARCYKEAVEACLAGTFTKAKAKQWKQELASVYNRGFSTGFYFGTPGKEGISYDKADNISEFKKEQVGKVVHYYPKIKVASIELKHRGIKLNDQIVIEGKNTFLEQRIESMQIKGKDIKQGKKGGEVAITVNKKVRKNDKLFIITNRT